MATKSNLNLYSRLKTKIHCIKSNILFLKKCKKYKLIPNFIKIKCTVLNSTTKKVINASKRMWLNLEISSHFQKLSSIELELYNLHLLIIKNMTCDYEYNQWIIFCTKLYENISVSIRVKNGKLHEKFMTLLRGKNATNIKKPLLVNDFVKNLSSVQFNEKELELLNLGLKFATKPVYEPIKDVVVDIETMLKFESESVKHHVRSESKNILKDFKRNRDFTYPYRMKELEERRNIIKGLKQKDVYYIKADKGNSIVIMDKSDYDRKMCEYITSGSYIKVKRSPLSKMVNNSKVLIDQIQNVFRDEKGKLNKKLSWQLKVSNPRVPMLHGLPKIHKSGPLRMRPIVSNINSPNYKLAKWLIRQLKDFPRLNGCSIKNSIEIVENIKELIIADDEILISFDVEALFPSIPVDEALDAMDEWLTNSDIEVNQKHIFLLVAKTCMGDSYFQFRDNFYKLSFGTSMGNPISPLIADLFMSKFEMRLKCQNLLPRWWYRYVDDVVAVIKKSDVDKTLEMLNSQSATIKFTQVSEENGQLPFLDLLLIRNNENRIDVSVYHKPTSTQRFIPSTSHCPIQHKMAPFHSLAYRLCRLPLSLSNYIKEYDYIQKSAVVNGYERTDIDRIIKKHSDKIWKNNRSTLFSQREKEKTNRICLTYAPSITNRLKSTFRRQKMEIVYRTQNKLGSCLGSTKDKIGSMEKSGIYEVTCGDCGAVYYGQTRRQISIRYKEHLASIRKNKPNESSIAEHSLKNLHFDFKDSNIKVKKAIMNSMQLDAYESLFIHCHPKLHSNTELMNSDCGNISSYLFNYV